MTSERHNIQRRVKLEM